MRKRYDRLPPGLPPRGLTGSAAAAYVGLSEGRFAQARKEGKYPDPSLPGRRYDLFQLNEVMNALSGLKSDLAAANPLDAWRARRAR
jgi:hypothetical protein